jgi:acetyl esterase/lipase
MTTLRYGALLQAIGSLRGEFDGALTPTETDVRYRAHAAPGIEPHADIYLPAAGNGSSVVLVHGGAFVIGSRRTKPIRFLASRLCNAGVAVCAIDYRLIFRGGRIDEAVADVTDALTFWRARAQTAGLDLDRLSMLGLSAGATLAMLAAGQEAAPRIARLACAFGLYDVEHLRGRLGELLPRLLFKTADRLAWVDRTPLRARQPAVPTLLLHGSDDGLVPVEQSRRLAEQRERLGLPTRLVIYPGAPHGFFNQPCAARDEGLREIIEHVSAR